MNFIKNTAAGITADPKKADTEFEDLRKQFKNYSDAVDRVKSNAKKLQDETRCTLSPLAPARSSLTP